MNFARSVLIKTPYMNFVESIFARETGAPVLLESSGFGKPLNKFPRIEGGGTKNDNCREAAYESQADCQFP